MKRGIVGFFMAWGMFLAIPCPCKRWDESCRPHMLAALPLVGLSVGGVWVACGWLFSRLPAAVYALLMAALPWLCTGLIHLDGYVDVCDAVLSRRDLEARRRILKDPHCGAFGVICVVLLTAAQWSLFLGGMPPHWAALLLTPAATRSCAALAVLLLRPMGSSQYVQLQAPRTRFVIFPALLLLSSVAVPLAIWRSAAPLAAAAAYWLCVWHGFRQMDGMNGDISGYALTLGELAGVAVMTLVG